MSSGSSGGRENQAAQQAALAALGRMNEGAQPITAGEHRERLARLQALMARHEVAAVYLNAGSNLTYFTGLRWSPSERMVGAVLTAAGELVYIAPAFERGTIMQYMVVEGSIRCWEEHESAAALLFAVLAEQDVRDAADSIEF